MAAPKAVKTMAGTAMPPATAGSNPTVPPNLHEVYEAVLQLQGTVNEIVSRFHAHTHTANDTVIIAGQRVQGGAGVAATNLFTDN